jgi:glycosyltransferase involved in cell wall biosynthesis
MTLTDQAKERLKAMIDAGQPLPPRYKPVLFDRPRDPEAPELSVVISSYNIPRELPRTLRSLADRYQKGIAASSYEVIVVDNGSTSPPVVPDFSDLDLDLRIFRYDVRSRSPATALNQGLAVCRGELIGVVIDGARMASPGLLAAARAAARLHERPIIYTQSLALGYSPQWRARENGYDQEVEDRLLDSIGWPSDGYRLFEIANWPTSETSEARWLLPGYESNALFMPRALWEEVGGYDLAFQSSGGGCLNADLFIRACGRPDTQLVVIAGEATFHQLHTNSSATAHVDMPNRLKAFSREYYSIRKRPLRPPRKPYWLMQIAPAPLPHPAKSSATNRWVAAYRE